MKVGDIVYWTYAECWVVLSSVDHNMELCWVRLFTPRVSSHLTLLSDLKPFSNLAALLRGDSFEEIRLQAANVYQQLENNA